jgi:UDP-glucose 4-epimerase
MNLLMSGGSGFIGSYFLNKFNDQNLTLDLISRRTPSNYQQKKSLIYNFDISKPITFYSEKKYDFFLHLAGANDIDSKNPFEALSKSSYGTRNCLEFCINNNIKRFIYFSTLQVYGDNNRITESDNVLCRNDYALTHYFAEQYVRMFSQYGIDFIILRPSNIYGPFESSTVNRWSLVPGCFCKEAKINAKIKLLSSGKQKRDFISLEDVFGFTFHLIKNFESFKNEVYNLASGDVHAIIELAHLVKSRYEITLEKKCEIVIDSNFPLKTQDYQVSIEKLVNTGYHIHSSSKAKIIETIDNLLRS